MVRYRNDSRARFTHGLSPADVPGFLHAWRAREVPAGRAITLARRDAGALLTALDGDAATRDAVVRLLGEAFASVGDIDALRPLASAVARIAEVPPGGDRAAHRRLLTLLLPSLDAAARWDLSERWRALGPAPDPGAADTLDLLSACGRAITRADLDVLLAGLRADLVARRRRHVGRRSRAPCDAPVSVADARRARGRGAAR